MKTIIVMVMATIAITARLCAQVDTSANYVFNVPAEKFTIKIATALGNGNKLEIQLSEASCINYVKDLDSILSSFFKDILQLKDQLGSDVNTRKIDYLMYSPGMNKIRIHKNETPSTYVSNNGKVSLLKVGQDTIYITCRLPQVTGKKEEVPECYMKINLFVNNIMDINDYVNSGLHDRLFNLDNDKKDSLVNSSDSVEATTDTMTFSPKIKIQQDVKTFTANIFAGLQNYKNYFVPSLGLQVLATFQSKSILRMAGVRVEGLFSFEKNTAGDIKSRVSTMIVLSYEQSKIDDTPKRAFRQSYITLGYMLKNNAGFIDRHSFRAGVGKVSLFAGGTRIEPVVYFHDLFHGLSPGIILIQHF